MIEQHNKVAQIYMKQLRLYMKEFGQYGAQVWYSLLFCELDYNCIKLYIYYSYKFTYFPAIT